MVGRSAGDYAAQSGLRESREDGEAAISAPLQVIVVSKLADQVFQKRILHYAREPLAILYIPIFLMELNLIFLFLGPIF